MEDYCSSRGVRNLFISCGVWTWFGEYTSEGHMQVAEALRYDAVEPTVREVRTLAVQQLSPHLTQLIQCALCRACALPRLCSAAVGAVWFMWVGMCLVSPSELVFLSCAAGASLPQPLRAV